VTEITYASEIDLPASNTILTQQMQLQSQKKKTAKTTLKQRFDPAIQEVCHCMQQTLILAIGFSMLLAEIQAESDSGTGLCGLSAGQLAVEYIQRPE
jgi:hypothetical protein